jgi:hypothetical protein
MTGRFRSTGFREERHMKPVLVTTSYRGVFAGLIPDDQDLTVKSMPLKAAKMATYWGTTRGVMELCQDGPTPTSRISAEADIAMLHDITAVFTITDKAWAIWQSA